LDLNILFASKLLAPCKQNALSEKRQSREREERETEGKGRGHGEGKPLLQSSSNGAEAWKREIPKGAPLPEDILQRLSEIAKEKTMGRR